LRKEVLAANPAPERLRVINNTKQGELKLWQKYIAIHAERNVTQVPSLFTSVKNAVIQHAIAVIHTHVQDAGRWLMKR